MSKEGKKQGIENVEENEHGSKVMNNSIMKKIVFGIALVGSMLSFGEETYTFTNSDEVGTFTVPNGQYAKAEILLVGGGGAGGTVGQDVIQGAAGGGGAGGVSHREVILEGGTYFVNVGRGGQKAQNSTSSWVGDDGEYTTLAFNNSTNFIATVKGGGGGGSVKIGGNGTPGASGGGGSWFGTFMNGGSVHIVMMIGQMNITIGYAENMKQNINAC